MPDALPMGGATASLAPATCFFFLFLFFNKKEAFSSTGQSPFKNKSPNSPELQLDWEQTANDLGPDMPIVLFYKRR